MSCQNQEISQLVCISLIAWAFLPEKKVTLFVVGKRSKVGQMFYGEGRVAKKHQVACHQSVKGKKFQSSYSDFWETQPFREMSKENENN